MKVKQFLLDTTTTGNATPWHMLDWRQNPFAVSFHFEIASGTPTYSVQYGYCDLIPKKVNITNSTTTATVVWKNHGLKDGDSVVISGAEYADGTDQTATTLNGTFAITRVDANSFTYAHTTNDGTVIKNQATAMFIRPMVHDSVATKTTSEDGNLAYSVPYIRSIVTTGSAGQGIFTVTQGSN